MFKFRYHKRAARCIQALAAASLLITAGCDKAAQTFEDLRDSSNPGAVPSEIADACLVLVSLGSELRLPHGYRFGDLIAAVEGLSQMKDASWEKSQKGYIWRWKLHKELEQVEIQNAFEFRLQEQRSDQLYQGDECGPTLLRTAGAISNGKPLQDMTVSMVFMNAAEVLKQRVSSSTAPATVSARQQTDAAGTADTDISSAQEPPTTTEYSDRPSAAEAAAAEVEAQITAGAGRSSSSEPITTEWLRGTWGPADYNPDNNPNASCDTDSTVTFQANGSYTDGGSEGRYRTDGKAITYFNRVLVDMGTETRDRSQYNQPLVTRVTRVDRNTMRENGALFRRCQN